MALVEDIISVLEGKSGLTAKEICYLLEIDPEREKEIYEVLKKAAKVVKRKGKRLMMIPPKCRNCGFEFDKPRATKCPKCKSERIEAARFFIAQS
jgi:hypothetical protein